MAKKILQKKIQELKKDPKKAIRLIPSPSDIGQLEMGLDKGREGDEVVESDDGIKVLLIGVDLVPAQEGMVIVFRETPQGTNLTTSKLGDDT